MGPRLGAVVRALHRAGPLVVLVGLAAGLVALSAVAAVPGGGRGRDPERGRGIVPDERRPAGAAGPRAPATGSGPAAGAAVERGGEVPHSGPAATDSVLGMGGRLLLGALLLAGLLVAAARYARRLPLARLLPSADGPIRMIGRTHLGPKGSLALVQVERTLLLIAVTPTAIQTLHAWDAPPGDREPARAAPAPPGQLRGLEARLARGRG